MVIAHDYKNVFSYNEGKNVKRRQEVHVDQTVSLNFSSEYVIYFNK